MRADIHDGREHMLQSETGYIEEIGAKLRDMMP
jgi:hypothetical protein